MEDDYELAGKTGNQERGHTDDADHTVRRNAE